MRRDRILGVCIALITCLVTPTGDLSAGEARGNCWTHIVQLDDVRNLVYLCIENGDATSFVFFANRPGPSAICRRLGHILNLDQRVFTIELGIGRCSNDRLLAASTLECRFEEGERLVCADDSGYAYEFVAESLDLYQPPSIK